MQQKLCGMQQGYPAKVFAREVTTLIRSMNRDTHTITRERWTQIMTKKVMFMFMLMYYD
jgi:hypothetical protein